MSCPLFKMTENNIFGVVLVLFSVIMPFAFSNICMCFIFIFNVLFQQLRFWLLCSSNFIMWFPITTVSVLSQYGDSLISQEMCIWISLTSLAFTPLINPFLYTITTDRLQVILGKWK